MSDIIEYQEPTRKDLFAMEPEAMVQNAAKTANVLKRIINEQKLSSQLGGRQYVHAEGWTTMGAMLGILPREKNVIEHADGTFEACVELYSLSSGRVVGQASAICGSDERNWAARPKYARRSMAITRATGKAYRLGFGWIMHLAGFAVTPAEEMEELQDKKKPSSDDVIYNQENPTHAERMEAYLEKEGVPAEEMLEVSKNLHGKPKREWQDVIKEVREAIKKAREISQILKSKETK